MEVEGVEYDMPAGTVMLVPPFAMHRSYAMGQDTVELMEIFSPVRADYLHLTAYQKEAFGDKGEAWVKEGQDSWNPPPA